MVYISLSRKLFKFLKSENVLSKNAAKILNDNSNMLNECRDKNAGLSMLFDWYENTDTHDF